MIAARDKLPWLDATVLVASLVPYVFQECRRGRYRMQRNPLAGMCYVASEAIYHLSEDPLEPWSVRYNSGEGQTHWFLKHAETQQIIDVTASQFDDTTLFSIYDVARRRAFGSKEPSRRAQQLLAQVDRRTVYRQTLPAGRYPYDYERGTLHHKKRKARDSNPESKP